MLMAVYGLRPWELARFTQGELRELVDQLPDVQRSQSQVELVRYR